MNPPRELTLRLFDEARDSVSELTALLNRAYAPLAEMGLRYVATWQGDEITLKRIRGGECWIALVGGDLVGTVVFKACARTSGWEWYDRPEVASFGQFAVAPEWQGRGVGGALLELCERRARETGAAELACDTAEPAEHLIAYYTRRGYRVTGTADWRLTNYRSVILSKRLRV
jgi:GNAT superfamily N-acetyltransferase